MLKPRKRRPARKNPIKPRKRRNERPEEDPLEETDETLICGADKQGS